MGVTQTLNRHKVGVVPQISTPPQHEPRYFTSLQGSGRGRPAGNGWAPFPFACPLHADLRLLALNGIMDSAVLHLTRCSKSPFCCTCAAQSAYIKIMNRRICQPSLVALSEDKLLNSSWPLDAGHSQLQKPKLAKPSLSHRQDLNWHFQSDSSRS